MPMGNWNDRDNGNSTCSIMGKPATVFTDKQRNTQWRWMYDDIMSHLFDSKEKAQANLELVVLSSGLRNVTAYKQKSKPKQAKRRK